MKKFFDIDYRTADVSKEIVPYFNCNVMYMDYSYTKLMYKMVGYAMVEAGRKVAASKHLTILAKEAKATILEHEAKWKEETALVGSLSDKLTLNPNVQKISLVNLDDGSIPPLLDDLIYEYERSLMERTHELIAMMSIEDDLIELLNSSTLSEDEEDAHSLEIRKKYYSVDNYQVQMQMAIEEESDEQMKEKTKEIIEECYAKYKGEFEGLEDSNYQSLPYPLNFILSAVKQKQLKKDN